MTLRHIGADRADPGYHLTAGEGPAWWFLDTRMRVKADGARTGGACTLLEFSAPPGFGPPLGLAGELAETPWARRMTRDPVITNPGLYTVIFENDRVRVLEYRDTPGATTSPHWHPDSVMYTLSSFRRRLNADGRDADVRLPAGQVCWLAAQQHSGHNTGDTNTHVIFVELKDPPAGARSPATRLGPGA